MYWTDWMAAKIFKCGMNNDRYQKAIVTDGLGWPNGLTMGKLLITLPDTVTVNNMFVMSFCSLLFITTH